MHQYDLPTRVKAKLTGFLTSLPEPLLRLAGAPHNRDGNVLDADVALSLRIAARIQDEEHWDGPIEVSRANLDNKAYFAASRVRGVGSVTEQQARVSPGLDSLQSRVSG